MHRIWQAFSGTCTTDAWGINDICVLLSWLVAWKKCVGFKCTYVIVLFFVWVLSASLWILSLGFYLSGILWKLLSVLLGVALVTTLVNTLWHTHVNPFASTLVNTLENIFLWRLLWMLMWILLWILLRALLWIPLWIRLVNILVKTIMGALGYILMNTTYSREYQC